MIESYRGRFPLLSKSNVHYFDYAATSPIPDVVIAEWVRYQSEVGVFVGKGGGVLSRSAERKFFEAENTLRDFFSAGHDDYLIYGKNVTELINILALSLRSHIRPMDVIMVGPYEHHSNHLPWKYLAKERNAIFLELPIGKDGEPDYGYIASIPGELRIFSFSAISNANGFHFDIDKALEYLPKDCLIFEDDSQLVAHQRLCRRDRVMCRLVPSHKMYGPKNIAGALIRPELFCMLEPVLLGGGMVDYSGFRDTWKQGASSFLAGTYDIGLIAAWAAACNFMTDISFPHIEKWENYIGNKIENFLNGNSGFHNLAFAGDGALFSFVHERIHAHDIAHFLSERGIIVRAGHLCATGTMRKSDVHAITRISIGMGVDDNDVDTLLQAMEELNGY